MTSQNQKIHLNAELWPDACKQQGWNPRDRDKLYDIYARVLGHLEPHKTKLAKGGRISACDFKSVGTRDDFGEVKKELLLLAGKDLLGDSPGRRRLLWIIEQRLTPCYRLYRPEAALDTILRERFGRRRGLNTIHDLADPDLEKLIFTLEGRVNDCRNEAGHSHHEMCAKAEVELWKPCPKDCWICYAERDGSEPFKSGVEEPVPVRGDDVPF